MNQYPVILMAKIFYDQNIVLGEKYFSSLGIATSFSGRELKTEDLTECEHLITRSVTKVNESLLKGSPVRFVGTATAGTDHIDKNYLKKQGIPFASAPGSNAISVSEWVLSALARLDLLGNSQKLNVGIIGYGNVGKIVEKRLRCLGYKTFAYDPFLKKTNPELGLCEREELFSADILCVHCSLTRPEDTETPSLNMLNEDFFQSMQKDFVLINGCRGEVVVESDLLKYRASGKIKNLVLDVFWNEPTPNISILTACDFATPHIAGYSYTGKVRGTQMVFEALSQFTQISEVEIENEIPLTTLKISGESTLEILTSAILSVYDIQEDHNAFLQSWEVDNKAAKFDALRKNYPIRYEFEDHKVNTTNAGARKILSKLGFQN